MTPTNTTMTPEIKNIADNSGDKHTVVPTPHTHSRDEVDGLVDALNAKADTKHSHTDIYETKGFQTAIVETVKDPSESNTTYIQLGFQDDREEEFYQYARISLQNLNNLKRALLNPDATPTADSDNLVTSGGVKAAIAEKADKSLIDNTVNGIGRAFIQLSTDDETEIHFEIQVAKNGVTDNADITVDNIPNLQRALQTPDSTPTANSDKLVTSGGVKAAIDDATKAVFGSMPYYITAAHEKMKVHTRILRNNTGSTIKLTECIDVSALPAAERHVYWNSPDIDLPNNTEIGIRFVRTSNAIFLYYDGNFDY